MKFSKKRKLRTQKVKYGYKRKENNTTKKRINQNYERCKTEEKLSYD